MARPWPTFVRMASSGFFDERGAAPFAFGIADAEEEIAQEFGAAFGVVHFDVELHGVDFSLGIFERGDGVVGVAGGAKARGHFAHVIAVAVPDAEGFRDASEERRCRGAVFTLYL